MSLPGLRIYNFISLDSEFVTSGAVLTILSPTSNIESPVSHEKNLSGPKGRKLNSFRHFDRPVSSIVFDDYGHQLARVI